MKLFAIAFAIASALVASSGSAEESSLFLLERKIPLGEVRGRIDHLAVDLKRGRLFVAELENNSVAVVDLDTGNVMQITTGLSKPQGLGYHVPTDTLYVANGGNGTLAMFSGDGYRPIASITVGDDADNVRVDEIGNQVFVAYGDNTLGNGALGVIDPIGRTKIADIALKAHPESFQIHRGSNRIFLNDPTNASVALVDLAARRLVSAWPTNNGSNFPMTLNNAAEQVVVAFRAPAKLGVFSMKDGTSVTNSELCGDADDMFMDTKRQRIYVSCGEGFIETFDARGGTYNRIGRIATAAGARTSLFVPELDLLFLAARATASEPATIWVFRPNAAADNAVP
jgi:hypothetical protein